MLLFDNWLYSYWMMLKGCTFQMNFNSYSSLGRFLNDLIFIYCSFINELSSHPLTFIIQMFAFIKWHALFLDPDAVAHMEYKVWGKSDEVALCSRKFAFFIDLSSKHKLKCFFSEFLCMHCLLGFMDDTFVHKSHSLASACAMKKKKREKNA